jgi:hypothetical protein
VIGQRGRHSSPQLVLRAKCKLKLTAMVAADFDEQFFLDKFVNTA